MTTTLCIAGGTLKHIADLKNEGYLLPSSTLKNKGGRGGNHKQTKTQHEKRHCLVCQHWLKVLHRPGSSPCLLRKNEIE